MASPLSHKIHNHKSAVVGGVMSQKEIMQIPNSIGEQEVLLSAVIDSQCKHTKNCTHTFGDKVLGKAKWAAITKPNSTGSCSLFLCYNEDELTDTSHESIEDAKEQAEWEYEGISNVWQNAT